MNLGVAFVRDGSFNLPQRGAPVKGLFGSDPISFGSLGRSPKPLKSPEEIVHSDPDSIESDSLYGDVVTKNEPPARPERSPRQFLDRQNTVTITINEHLGAAQQYREQERHRHPANKRHHRLQIPDRSSPPNWRLKSSGHSHHHHDEFLPKEFFTIRHRHHTKPLSKSAGKRNGSSALGQILPQASFKDPSSFYIFASQFCPCEHHDAQRKIQVEKLKRRSLSSNSEAHRKGSADSRLKKDNNFLVAEGRDDKDDKEDDVDDEEIEKEQADPRTSVMKGGCENSNTGREHPGKQLVKTFDAGQQRTLRHVEEVHTLDDLSIGEDDILSENDVTFSTEIKYLRDNHRHSGIARLNTDSEGSLSSADTGSPSRQMRHLPQGSDPSRGEGTARKDSGDHTKNKGQESLSMSGRRPSQPALTYNTKSVPRSQYDDYGGEKAIKRSVSDNKPLFRNHFYSNSVCQRSTQHVQLPICIQNMILQHHLNIEEIGGPDDLTHKEKAKQLKILSKSILLPDDPEDPGAFTLSHGFSRPLKKHWCSSKPVYKIVGTFVLLMTLGIIVTILYVNYFSDTFRPMMR